VVATLVLIGLVGLVLYQGWQQLTAPQKCALSAALWLSAAVQPLPPAIGSPP
jgi:hypothetical protein